MARSTPALPTPDARWSSVAGAGRLSITGLLHVYSSLNILFAHADDLTARQAVLSSDCVVRSLEKNICSLDFYLILLLILHGHHFVVPTFVYDYHWVTSKFVIQILFVCV